MLDTLPGEASFAVAWKPTRGLRELIEKLTTPPECRVLWESGDYISFTASMEFDGGQAVSVQALQILERGNIYDRQGAD